MKCEEVLFYKFTSINTVLEKRNKRSKSQRTSINKGQGRVLSFLQRCDGISTKDLAKIIDIRVTSLNESLNKLEQMGYVEKIPSKEDGRVLIINLTEKGRNFEFEKPRDIDIFDCLDDDEKENLDRILNKLIFELQMKLKEENPKKFEELYKARREFFEKYFRSNKKYDEWFDFIRN